MAKRMCPRCGFWLSVIGGWLLIGYGVYVYVVLQATLIRSMGSLVMIVGGGALLGFLFSSLEAAVLSVGPDEKIKIQKFGTDLQANTSLKPGKRKRLERAYERYSYVINDRTYHVAPLIIFSNLTTIGVAALLPGALNIDAVTPNLYIDISWIADWFGTEKTQLVIPFTGRASLNLFASSVVLIMIGKIMPKRVGSHPRCKYVLVTKCSYIIKFVSITCGWLGVAINAPINALLPKES